MKHSLSYALVVCFFLSLTALAHAQCTSPTINSFTLSPNVISGDESQLATGAVQACNPQGS